MIRSGAAGIEDGSRPMPAGIAANAETRNGKTAEFDKPAGNIVKPDRE